MTTPSNSKHISERFGEYADDFFCAILILKQTNFINDSLPFLHAHCLELAAKSVALKNNIDLAGINGYDIHGIYRKIEERFSEFSEFIPTDQHLLDYKKVFVRSDVQQRNSILPDPPELDSLELAYFIDNAKNLKYEFTKDFIQLTILKIAGPSINKRFFKLFKLSRDFYANDKMNTVLKGKISQTFKDLPDLETNYFKPLGL